jgi:hypothetical protein
LLALCLVLLAVGGGCYKPGFEDCQLTCGGQDNLCPDGFHCESGRCRAAGMTGACAPVDAAVDPPDADPLAPDADPLAPDAMPMIDATPAPDANCSGGTTCDLYDQTCCAGNEACDVNGSGEPICRPLGGALGQTNPCTSANQCAAGATCVSAEAAGPGNASSCHRFCENDGQCAGGGGTCNLPLDGASDVKVCGSDCQPGGPEQCASGWACSLFLPAGDRYHSDCRPVIGDGKQGDPCALSQDCRKGFQCAADVGECQRLCIIAGTPACNGTFICTPFVPDVVVDGKQWGVCR